MNDNIHFSSKSDDWFTPQDFFEEIAQLHGPFDLDVCASPENTKCRDYFSKDDNGLSQTWTGTCWMNPPYGRQIGLWMKKAHDESLRGAKVVCLVPARTDTKWWHDYATKGEIYFIKGRLKFGGSDNSAPFPSAVIVFAPYGKMKKHEEKGCVCSECNQSNTVTRDGQTQFEPYMRPSEVAEWLGLSKVQVLRMFHSGQIPGNRVGTRSIRFQRSKLIAALNLDKQQ